MTEERKQTSVIVRQHWLVRPQNIRRMWWIFLGVLALTVVVQWPVEVHDHFGADGLLGFYAAYGFLTCVAMVIVAKVLGWWLKRPDDYYPDEGVFLWAAGRDKEPIDPVDPGPGKSEFDPNV